MVRGRGLAVLVAVAFAVAVTVIVALVTAPGPRSPALPSNGIVAGAALSQRTVLFGDAVIARVEVLVDRTRIDPQTVALAGSYSPYTADPPRARRTTLGDAAHVTFVMRLRCLLAECLPPGPNHGGNRTFTFAGARVLFVRSDGTRGSVLVRMPSLEVASRLTPKDQALVEQFQQAPFHASLALGPIQYATSPGLLVALLLTGAALLLAVAALLVLRLVRGPRRGPEPRALGSLERALLAVETARAQQSVADERKALELLAEELGRSNETELAGSAKNLAWSATGPTTGTMGLTEDVRKLVNGSNGRPA